MVKNKNGITLVALVVTIILLVLLAGVTISNLTGSGLFEKARQAEEKSENSQVIEETILSEYENKIDKYITGQRDIELTQEIKDYIDTKINEKTITKEGTITKDDSIEEIQMFYFKYNDNSVIISMGIQLKTDLEPGQSATIGKIDQEECIPSGYGARGLGYYGSRGFIGIINSYGEISVRNIGTETLKATTTANAKLTINFNYNIL